MKELLYRLWLTSKPNFGAVKVQKLLSYFGSYEEIFNYTQYAQLSWLSENDQILLLNKSLETAYDISVKCEENRIDIITIEDDRYPPLLRQIPDPPQLLYVRGQFHWQDCPASVAVVGTRHATRYGKAVAELLAGRMAEYGVEIISGMARGIDTAAHMGAIKADGRTVAVLGCGVDVVYPPENRYLMDQIIATGTVISEYPPGTRPLPQHFPVRNRIISGLSAGVLVVEAAPTSGTSITVNLANDQGRMVFAVPGNIDSKMSAGPNQLIRDGCTPVTCAEDLLQEIIPAFVRQTQQTLTETPIPPGLSDEEKVVYQQLSMSSIVHIDDICTKTGLEMSVVNGILFRFQLRDIVKQLPGRKFALCVRKE